MIYKSSLRYDWLMLTSLSSLPELLTSLSQSATQRGLSDSRWASLAGVRKESLSRLRRRHDCDFRTLAQLASAVGYRIGVQPAESRATTPDGHFPETLGRDEEDVLLALALSRDLNVARWKQSGPQFFMAGFAVLLAGMREFERRPLLDLASQLHPGICEPDVFRVWLRASPLQPARFLPLLEAALALAA
jgi:hypothetical protein